LNDDAIQNLSEAIDAQHSELSASTRRQLVAGAAGTVAGMTALGMLPDLAMAQRDDVNSPEAILTVAATAEVLATIVNTVGREQIDLDRQTDANVAAAAREELIHYEVLESLGARPVTKMIHVPDEVFANARNFLETLEVGDQIFVNAYLIGTTTFASKRYRDYKLARATAEFAGVEAVHRALARQSLGKLGNDRVFMRYGDIERAADAPNVNAPGFFRIPVAVEQLEAAGFGFGKAGSKPGRMYDFDQVRQRTPNPDGLNSTTPN
jgi:hypothetical protein